MKLKRFDDFTHIFLVNASQMAYIEEARSTHAMLQKFSDLYRYLIRSENTAMLNDELKALLNYLELQKDRHQNRFNITLDNKLRGADVYVRHLCLLEFVDDIMDNALSRYENCFDMLLEIKNSGGISIAAFLEAEGNRETYDMTLTEEGK